MCLFKMHEVSSASACTSTPLGLDSLYSILPNFSFHFLCVSRCKFIHYADIVLSWSFVCSVPRVRVEIVWADLRQVDLISNTETKVADSVGFKRRLPNCVELWGKIC